MSAVITWHALNDDQTCDNCADLDGQEFTTQTLPGWPGDGTFGDPVLCEGGPNCRCTLTYSDDQGNQAFGENTLREPALAGLLSADMGPVGHINQWIAGRQAFTDALPDVVQPNEVYSAQARAVMRDQVRVQIAQEMGVHPADVPASMVANRVPAIYKKLDGNIKVVYKLLEKHYPDSAIEWIGQMKWAKRDVPIEKISVTGPASDKDAKTIRKMSKKMRKGKPIKPLVLIDPGDKGLLQVADGHHRATAALHANKQKVPAYVGTPQTEDNWRKEVMDMQIVRAKKGVYGPAQTLNGWPVFEASGTGPTSTAYEPGGGLVVDPSDDPVAHPLATKDGNAQALIDWYNEGADGGIDWGSDGDFDDCVDIAGAYIDDPDGFCQLRHIDATGAPAGHAPGESQDKNFSVGQGFAPFDLSGPELDIKYAGLLLMAADSGRVLMLQRSLSENDEAAGKWEFPGGGLEEGEEALEGAMREWQEEVGSSLPPIKIIGRWASPNGYMGFLGLCRSESDIDIKAREVVNPDDPDGDNPEAVAWFWPSDLVSMPGVRRETRDLTPWARIVTRTVAA